MASFTSFQSIIQVLGLVNFEMENDQLDEEQQEQLKNLWKIYGRQSKMGKELFALYNKAEKPKLVYPKVKPKSQSEIEAEKTKMVSTKKCPQKTQIQYPDIPKPAGRTYYPVDFIPKRKAESVIRQQIEEYKRKRMQDKPANRGVDRAALVRKLQQKFKQQGGGLPKGAQLPTLSTQIKFDEAEIREKAKLRVEKKFKTYSEPIKSKEQNVPKRSVDEELGELFDQIVGEIDDRQKYLDSIQHLDEPQLKAKIKKQMIERIAQLQRITELKKK